MTMYESLLRPLLFRLDPEVAHHLAMRWLSLAQKAPQAAKLMRKRAPQHRRLRMTLAGLEFPNPVGLAAGLDKNGVAITGLFSMGFGSVEVGTVTPRPQPGNPKPRLFRLPEHRALINRLGFNNQGVQALADRLRQAQWRPGPVGVNIGKNKETPLEAAAEDYASCAQVLAPVADYLAVNLSSPNTPGLRKLQEPEALAGLLRAVRASAGGRPIFLKIAPDLSDEGVDAVVDVARDCGIDALICTNTTLARPITHALAGEAGGLSGGPLAARSTEIVRRAFRRSGGALPIIGVGGILDGEAAWAKICAGASLVQIYSGFIYRGPPLVGEILRILDSKLAECRLDSLSQAVGRDAA